MKKCPNCGHKIKKKDKFCPSCGKKLVKPTKKKQVKKIIPKVEKEPEKKVKKGVNKAVYGYLAMISFFLFTLLTINLSERAMNVVPLLDHVLFVGGAIFYFAWFGLGLYLMKDEETMIHGIILFILWLIFGMKSFTYQEMPWYERIFK